MKAIGLFSIFIALFMSCSKEPLIEMDREAFEREFAAWNEQNIQNYQFSYECNRARYSHYAKIAIEEGKEPILMEPPDVPIERVPYRSIAHLYEEINSYFEDIEKIKKRLGSYASNPVKSATLHIEYDTQYHYPKKVLYAVHYINMSMIGIPPSVGGGHPITEVTDFQPNE